MTKPPDRGGPSRVLGRPPKAPEDRKHPVSLRLTKGQREKLQRIGGHSSLRQAIDKTPLSRALPKVPETRRAGPPADAVYLVTPVRMTDEQREKLEALGGSAWVRRWIDRAKEPT